MRFRSLVILERLTVTDSTIYAVGLAKSFASYTLHVTALSAETGELLTTQNIPSNIQNGSDDFLMLFPPTSEDPRLVWIEKGVVRSVALTPKLTSKPQSLRGSANTKILDVGLSEHGMFIVKKEDGSATVFKLNQNAFESLWDFADSVSCVLFVP
jgi:outer membrane protein assembly factor BamB